MIPDDVEKIIMTKKDYDRNVEQMLVNKLELEQRIIKAIDYIATKNLINGTEEYRIGLLKILTGEDKE